MLRKLPVLLILLLVACNAASGSPTSTLTYPATQATATSPVTQKPVTSPSPAMASSTVTITSTVGITPTTTQEPTMRPNEFKNPVIRSNFPDPFVLLVDKTYYAYATNGSGKNVQVATSADLVKWQLGPDAMPALASWISLSSPDIWAPEVLNLDGRYLLYYTGRDKASGKQCVGVAVSDQPGRGFKDARDQPLVCQVEEGGTIDPDPFRDGDKLYLYFKNDGNCCGFATHIYVQELSSDGLSVTGEPVALLRNDAPWEGKVIEAPTMFLHDGKYYLFFSANDYGGYQYAVGYATCQSATGPCQDAPENPILSSRMDQKPLVVGPGHQTLIQVGDQTWIIYHVWEILPSGIRSDRRMMWIDRIDWSTGAPKVLGPTTNPQPKP